MNLFASVVLTGTSVAPVLVVYALVAYIEGQRFPALALTLSALFLLGLGIFLLIYLKNNLEKLPFSFDKVEVADRESIGMLVVYLLPLLRTSFSDLEPMILIAAVAVFLALALTGYNYHFNPLLRFLGWNFYKVGTPEGVTYVLITRKALISAVGNMTVGQLTAYTLVDFEK